MGPGSRIKIAEVITRLDWGGSPDIVRIICSRLDPQAYDVTLVTGTSQNMSRKTREFLEKFGGKVIVIPSLKRCINPMADLAAFTALHRLFSKEKFDIVHTHTAKTGALGRLSARLAGTPVVVHTPHGHNFYGYFGPGMSRTIILIEKFLSNFADKIITLTELEKEDFVRFRVADENKLVVIYQGLELKGHEAAYEDKIRLKKLLGISGDDRSVGMIGRLEPVKGVNFFIEAAAGVTKELPKTKFIIVGEGSLRRELEDKARYLGLERNIIFTGWREDIPHILSVLDILVLPSLNEAVGMVLIEAQAEGVPVVATSVGGIPEVVRDNETGILVPSKDSKAMAVAVISLLKDENKRLRMGMAGKSWVEGRFRAEDMADRISALYTTLLDKKALSPDRKFDYRIFQR